VTCHSKGGDKENVPLDSYDGLAPYLKVEAAAGGEWIKVEEPISINKLTQSTHAHLLSFSVLFSLTGLVFACSSYPTWTRCVLGPWVVLAVFSDVSLWWLARLSDEWGPRFAMGIIMTGGLAGLGLAAQITLSLFNMYGPRGKIVIAALMLLGAGVAVLIFLNKVKPELEAKQNAARNPEPALNDNSAPKKNGEKKDPVEVPPKLEISALEKLLRFPVKGPDGKDVTMEETPFTGGEEGNMARAFFDKEKAYRTTMNDEGVAKMQKDKLHAAREGERRALVAWIRAIDTDRKSAYEADGFVLPSEAAGQPISPEYIKDGKLLIKTLIADRCLRCHGPGGKQNEEYPLESYELLRKYMNPAK
jgi:hypothetical protein